MLNLFKKASQGCDHTRFRLERKLTPQKQYNLGLPGLGTAISVSSKQQNYIYYCPACKVNLPPGENARWEGLFNSYRPTTKPLTGSGRASTSQQRSGRSPASAAKTRRNNSNGAYKRKAIGDKLRYDILTRDGNCCVKCGATKEQSRLHVDHKTPVSQGGDNDPSNLQTLCERCNLGKGARRG